MKKKSWCIVVQNNTSNEAMTQLVKIKQMLNRILK